MRLLVALVACASAIAPAIAQDASSVSSSQPAATASASASQPAPAVPKPAGGFTFAQVIGSLADPSAEAPAIAAIDKKTAVQFVEVHLLSGYDAAGLVFSAPQSDALKTLHKAIGRNNALMKQLRRAGYLLDDVVAVLSDPSGAPVVFIDL